MSTPQIRSGFWITDLEKSSIFLKLNKKNNDSRLLLSENTEIFFLEILRAETSTFYFVLYTGGVSCEQTKEVRVIYFLLALLGLRAFNSLKG